MGKVLIIGGGFTGLSAAKKFVEAGHEVVVAEGGEALGGLAASFSLNGEPIEKAYHHLFRTDEDILQLIDSVGAQDLLEWRESSVGILRDGVTWPFMSATDLLKFKPSSLIGRIRLGLAALTIKHSKNWRKFSHETALSWMTRKCGNSAVAAVWRPLLKGKFSGYYDKISMAWLWARLHVRSNSRDPSGGKERLGYIRGGFATFIDAIAQYLTSRGVTIHVDCRVQNLKTQDDGRPSVEIFGQTEVFDQVLFTGSNQGMSRLLPTEPQYDQYRSDLSQIDYLGAMCLVFTTSQKLGDHYWVNINEDDAPFLVFIRHTKLIPSERYGGEEVYYIGAYCPQDSGIFLQSEEEIRSIWFTYLKKIFPAFEESEVQSQNLFRFRDAQHVVQQGYEDKILSYESPQKGVFLSNFTQVYPEDRGTNFAVREGNRVADLMMQTLDKA